MATANESLRLSQEQKLQLRLNPQNVLLGRMLEMNVHELEDAVQRELDENPALERLDSPVEGEYADDGDFDESAAQLQLADYADIDDVPDAMRRRSGGASAAIDAPSLAAEENISLIDSLMDSLRAETDLSESDEKIARNIIGNLDNNGYMTRSLPAVSDDIALTEDFYPAAADVRRVFEAIRSMDPAGIGAVDLRDCLLLQLDRLPSSPVRDLAREIIDERFEMFSKRHFDRLRASLGIDNEQLSAALELIRTLNPKPASALDLGRNADHSRHVSPDVALEYDPDSDSFTVTLLGNIPELGIEASFSADASVASPDTASPSAQQRRNAALAFLRRKHDEAASFIRLVKMRGSTLLSIVTAIARLQKAFFISGDTADIKPMILRDVADLTGLDLPVISRATAGKYVSTRHGIFPLKLFFNERPDADSDISSHKLLDALKKIIDNEDKHNPLSDRELCDLMEQQGYDIARRTIAKYRERLGVPVARLRKEL